MDISMHYKHLECPRGFKSYVSAKMTKTLEKFEGRLGGSQLTFEPTKSGHRVTFEFSAPNGKRVVVRHDGGGLYECVDLLNDRVCRVLRKEKEKATAKRNNLVDLSEVSEEGSLERDFLESEQEQFTDS